TAGAPFPPAPDGGSTLGPSAPLPPLSRAAGTRGAFFLPGAPPAGDRGARGLALSGAPPPPLPAPPSAAGAAQPSARCWRDRGCGGGGGGSGTAPPFRVRGDEMASQSGARADQAIVLYDGACRFCRMSVGVLARLDWWHRLRFQSARGGELPASEVPLDRGR